LEDIHGDRLAKTGLAVNGIFGTRRKTGLRDGALPFGKPGMGFLTPLPGLLMRHHRGRCPAKVHHNCAGRFFELPEDGEKPFNSFSCYCLKFNLFERKNKLKANKNPLLSKKRVANACGWY
jgi:hypothetical protein